MGPTMKPPMMAEALDDEGAPDSEPGGDEGGGDDEGLGTMAPSKEEVMAMKAFDSASSPRERAAALKAFIKICSDSEDY